MRRVEGFMIDGCRFTPCAFGIVRVRVMAAVLALLPMAQPSFSQVVDRVVAVVGGQAITLSDVRAALDLALVPAPQNGDPIAGVLERLIERELMLIEVDRYAPPPPAPEAVDARWEALRARVGPEDLQAILRSNGMSERRLRDMIRDDLRIDAYLEQRFAAAAPVTGGGMAEATLSRQRMIDEWLEALRRRTDVRILHPLVR